MIAATGELVVQGTYLRVMSVGCPLEFGFTICSQRNYEGPLGFSVFCPWFAELRFEVDESIVHQNGFGRADRYIDPPGGAEIWFPEAGYAREIVHNVGDDTYTLRDRFGTLHTFAGENGAPALNANAGALLSTEDRHGNIVRYGYLGGALVALVDPLNRAVFALDYSPQGRVTQVRDLVGGRSVGLSYDPVGRLVLVEPPPLEQSAPRPAGAAFQWNARQTPTAPSGTFTQTLTGVSQPNQASPGQPSAPSGQFSLVVTTNAAGQVQTVTKGGQATPTGPSAGGTYTVSYTLLATSPPTDHNAPVLRATVTDRNGNVTEFDTSILGTVVAKREFTQDFRTSDPDFWLTSSLYNTDGLITDLVFHRGNAIHYTYDSGNPDPFQTHNLRSLRYLPGELPADQTAIEWEYRYEALFNRIASVVEPRGTDASYVPQTGTDPLGRSQASRYLTRRTFDYQEAEGPTNLGLAAYTGRFAINITHESFFNTDLNGDGKFGPSAQLVGNLIRIDYPDVVLLPGQNQAAIEGGPTQAVREVYQWLDSGQPLVYVDPEGNVTDYVYNSEDDPAGTGTVTPGGLNANGLAWGTNRGGFRNAILRDARALNALVPRRETAAFTSLAEHYVYRDDGCVVATRDARGIRTDFVVNPWNLVLRVTRAASVADALLNPAEQNTGLVAFGYFVDTVYDFNQNVVSRHVENRDGTTDDVSTTVDYTYTYDILDNLVEETAEATASVTLVTGYTLDPNENVVGVRSPLAMAGIQPNNQVGTLLDERDLVFRATRGAGSTEESAVEVDYDGARHAVVTRDGVDNDGDGLRDRSLALFDGFDRLQRATSPVGTEVVPNYDPASHVVRTRAFGTAGGASPVGNATTGNELLAESFALFDELGRGVRRDQRLFTSASAVFARTPVLVEGGAGGSLVPGDGNVNTMTEYDRASRGAFTVTDDLEVARVEFDGVDRVVRAVDPEGNEVRTTFDGQSNPILTEELDVAQIAGIASETFRTIRVFDALGRVERETDNIGQTRRFLYDSRDNLRATSDAQGAALADPLGLFSPGLINGPGNTSETFFDGVNRVIATVRHLRVGGTGAGAIDTSNPSNSDGLILVVQQWDRNSNLVAITDDGSVPFTGGNTTRYGYDNLNRKILDDFADPTTNVYTLDADDNVQQVVDENGSVIVMTFDGANRLLRKNVTRASGAVGTTLQEFEWDGLSRQTRAFDDNEPAPASDNATVTYAFDSLSRLLEEVQNGQAVSSRWAADDDRVGLVYPDGRQIHYTLDRLDRLDEVTEGGGGSTRGGLGEPAGTLVARYRYIGMGRVLERDYGNGVTLSYLDVATRSTQVGYDGARRIVAHRHVDFAASAPHQIKAAFTYGYNRENYRTFEVREHQSAEGDAWQYDSVYRIIRAARDVQNPALEASSPGSGGTAREVKTWRFDGLGNWDQTVLNGTPSTNANNEMNEYTSFGLTSQTHDDNGNLKDDGTLLLAYDFQNRLRSATRKSDGALLATYSYDAQGFGRRVRRAITAAGATAGQQQDGTDPHTVLYFHDGGRVVEEALDAFGVVRQYVDGGGIDEHLQLLVLQNRHQHWYHEDAKGWVAALTKGNGQVEERVTYETYGAAEFRGADNAPQSNRAMTENLYLYHGRALEPETLLYDFRARRHDSRAGRFVSRDPMGDPARDSVYSFAVGNPVGYRDPWGAEEEEEEEEEEKPTYTCCCANSVTITNVYQKGRGHHFEATFSLSFFPSAYPSPCILIWDEVWTFKPQGLTLNKHYEYGKPPSADANAGDREEWKKYEKQWDETARRGRTSFSLADEPTVSGLVTTRTIKFTITAKSSPPPCPCANDDASATATQTVQVNQDGTYTASFVPGPSSTTPRQK